jgi:hypothetical protein
VIEGGWVCRACWRPNGPNEERCYRCHTPRDQQLAVEAGSLQASTEPGAELKGRLDADLGLLAFFAVLPMSVSGVLSIVGGALIVVLGLILIGDARMPEVYGMNSAILLSFVGLVAIVVGALQIFLARSVRRHARWAYVVTLVLALVACAPRLLVDAPPELTNQVALTAWWIDTWIYVWIAFASTALLFASFVRRPVD